MPTKTYRFTNSISAVRPNGVASTVTQLPLGSEVLVEDEALPDSKGMTLGTHNGKRVLVFQRDLDEQAERRVTVKWR
jgi:hypothetical protein